MRKEAEAEEYTEIKTEVADETETEKVKERGVEKPVKIKW